MSAKALSRRAPALLAPVLLLTLVTLAGCAAGSSGGSGSTATPGSARSRTARGTITASDLATRNFQDCFQAIQNLRPRWLQRRGASGRVPVVFVDGIERGGLGTLRDIAPGGVTSIRYVSGADATTRFGTGFPGGIIEVSYRR